MMFNLKPPYINGYQHIQAILMRLILAISTIILSTIILTAISLEARASYLVVAQGNGGYNLHLEANATISKTPIKGSDGKNYYQVGNPLVVSKFSPAVSVEGNVLCVGKVFGSNSNLAIPSDNAYHRLFVYTPAAGTISGKQAYRINKNIVMTVESTMLGAWRNIKGEVCAKLTSLTRTDPIDDFSVHFPITFTFYVNEEIVDGQIMVPAMDLAGYSRALTNPRSTPPYSSLPIHETSAPVRLLESTLNVASSCSTMTSSGQAGTLNIKHGLLNSTHYDSSAQEKITYSCDFASLTKVKLLLDYNAEGDPQGRLPMTNSTDGSRIYSDLTLTDEETGQSGKELKVDIQDFKNITVSSHLQGNNAKAGNYSGSAFLIATFD